MFNECKIHDLTKNVLDGFNATVFAYGQTGSGKTYTMEGYQYDSKLRPVIQDSSSVGIIPRTIKSLFEHVNGVSSKIEYTVYCTFVQLYKEKIFDLLNPAQLKPNSNGLKLRCNLKEDFYVENLFMYKCSTVNEVLYHYHTGIKNKVMASHNLNSASSRSHCILGLTIEGVDSESGGITTSRLQLVDLAGSERVSMTGNEGIALKESIEINKSLFTLRQVISNLCALREGENVFVPYRDSKLTSVLKQSIGGNSFCVMISCLAPSDQFFEENISTLTYATKAGCIYNEPIKNVDPKTKVVKKLRQEISSLQSELQQAYKQIDILTEISKKKGKTPEVSSAPLKSSQTKRPQVNKQSATFDLPQSSPNKTQSSFNPDFANFMLTPELLSEKLHDSVQLIRDLMASNRQLKEILSEITQSRRSLENEVSQLKTENETLLEQLEEAKRHFKNNSDPQSYSKVMELLKEKEELEKRVAQLERENEQVQKFIQPPRNSEWKTKRTVISRKASAEKSRGKDNYNGMRTLLSRPPPSPGPKMTSSFELRPVTMSKEEAMNALSNILNSRASANAKKLAPL